MVPQPSLDIHLASLAADFQLRRTTLIMHDFCIRERWEPIPDAGYYHPKEIYFEPVEPKVPVADEALRLLLASQDFRVRLLTYSVFGKRLPKAWCDVFLAEARSMVQAPPEAEITALLAQLDDDAYAVREQATERLKRFADRAEAPLRKALSQSSSPEVRRRIVAILDELDREPEYSDLRPLIQTVMWLPTKEARTVIEIRASGPSNFRLARLAGGLR
jgi:hypothetical protein